MSVELQSSTSSSGVVSGLIVWLRALRVYQWVKNLLVFLPAVFAHRLDDRQVVVASFLAALSFSLMASAVYLFNDWRDCESDAQHPVKKHRPLAAGLVSPTSALAVMSGLALASVLAALALPLSNLLLIFTYGLVAVAYSLWLKRIMLADAFILAGFYTARIYAGSLATGIEVSQWLHLFSLFIFLALGFQKRYAELAATPETGKPLAGRGYHLSDIDHMRGMGHAAGFLAVLVFALYTHSPGVTDHYSNPTVLWWICPLILFWLCRLWLLTGRGQVSEDAILFALKDRTSFCLGVCAVVIALLAGPI